MSSIIEERFILYSQESKGKISWEIHKKITDLDSRSHKTQNELRAHWAQINELRAVAEKAQMTLPQFIQQRLDQNMKLITIFPVSAPPDVELVLIFQKMS